MNWKLILGLSVLGLGMAFATVYSIPPNIEPICWVIIFLFSTYFIASNAPGRYFLHGFIVTFADCVVTAVVQFLLAATYLPRHQLQVDLYAKLHDQTGLDPAQMILISRPLIGVVVAAVIGLLTMLCAHYLYPETAATATPRPQPADNEEIEAYAPSYTSYQSYDSYQTESAAMPAALPEPAGQSSLVYSLIVLVNPSTKQLNWVNDEPDNENAIVIPNVMNTPIKGLTFHGMHFDLIE